jgi:hypothetical protein
MTPLPELHQSKFYGTTWLKLPQGVHLHVECDTWMHTKGFSAIRESLGSVLHDVEVVRACVCLRPATRCTERGTGSGGARRWSAEHEVSSFAWRQRSGPAWVAARV